MVQIKVTASVLLAVAAIAPVVAVANGFGAGNLLVTREDNEIESPFSRNFDLEFEEREFEDDLFEREPRGGRFLKKAFSFGRKVGSSVSPPQTPSETREFNDDPFKREVEEELYGRGGRGKGFSMKAGGGSSGRMMKSGGGGRKAIGRARKALGRVASAGASETVSETREFDDDLLERGFEEELYARAGRSPSTRGSRPPVRPSSPSTRGTSPSPNEIKARISQIRAQIDAATSDYDREKLQERLAKLGRS